MKRSFGPAVFVLFGAAGAAIVIAAAILLSRLDRAFVLECSGVEYATWQLRATGESRTTTYDNYVVLRFKPGAAQPSAQVEIIESSAAPGPLLFAAQGCELGRVTCDIQLSARDVISSSEADVFSYSGRISRTTGNWREQCHLLTRNSSPTIAAAQAATAN